MFLSLSFLFHSRKHSPSVSPISSSSSVLPFYLSSITSMQVYPLRNQSPHSHHTSPVILNPSLQSRHPIRLHPKSPLISLSYSHLILAHLISPISLSSSFLLLYPPRMPNLASDTCFVYIREHIFIDYELPPSIFL